MGSGLYYPERDYEIGWHRDTGGEERDGSHEVEMEILGRRNRNLFKWHVALLDDPCLWIVPGSHRRYRTDEEREYLVGGKDGAIPGAKRIEVKRGQTVFWNANTIHRGLMPQGMKERLTLTGALERHRDGDEPDDFDARFRWMLADNVRDALPPAMLPIYDRWCSMHPS